MSIRGFYFKKFMSHNHHIFQDDLPNVSPKVLNEFLKELEEYGFIKKETVNSKTTEYNLTENGLHAKEFIIQYYSFLLKMSKTEKQKRQCQTFWMG